MAKGVKSGAKNRKTKQAETSIFGSVLGGFKDIFGAVGPGLQAFGQIETIRRERKAEDEERRRLREIRRENVFDPRLLFQTSPGQPGGGGGQTALILGGVAVLGLIAFLAMKK